MLAKLVEALGAHVSKATATLKAKFTANYTQSAMDSGCLINYPQYAKAITELRFGKYKDCTSEEWVLVTKSAEGKTMEQLANYVDCLNDFYNARVDATQEKTTN